MGSGCDHDVDTLWRDLDKRLDRLLPDSLSGRVEHRRFRITAVNGGRVPAVALSGESFEAPLDDSTELLVGNFHKRRNVITSGEEQQRRLLVELQLRPVDPAANSQTECLRIFRRFVETVAVDCLWAYEQAALGDILNKASHIDQTTLTETQHLLRDLLPGVLAQLKPDRGSACQQALQQYQDDESWIHRASAESDPPDPAELAKSKMALWRRLHEADASAELLSAVRAKIEDLGYSARNVLFELFQNADDAYAQLDTAPDDACFQVEIRPDLPDVPGGLRVAHWGRPVNHRGRNTDEGRRRGYDRDLVNMLLMNFSDKRPGAAKDDLTGKFGLGFKSVTSCPTVQESPAVSSLCASAADSCRWSGPSAARRRTTAIARTVARRPSSMFRFAADRTPEGEECIRAFRAALTWLPVFARRIRRVEVTGASPVTVECSCEALPGADAIDVVTVQVAGVTSRALRFDLGDGYSLLLSTDGVGPIAMSRDTPRIWNLAPLAEPVTSGWLLNGPFPVNPGRGRLAGSSDDHRSLFGKLGRGLGARLLALHDVTANDWARFAGAVGLDPSEHAARPRFWSRLFEVLRRDLDDPLARCLHDDGGYWHLASRRPVVPTGLPQPFDELVCAAEVTRRASGRVEGAGRRPHPLRHRPR